MTNIKVQTQISLETLLDSLQQLNFQELQMVEEKSALLRAQQWGKTLPEQEANLLLKINEDIVPPVVKARCAQLTQKSKEGTLTKDEETELAKLIDHIELLNAERTGHLVQLAKLRGQTIDELMKSLELAPLSYE